MAATSAPLGINFGQQGPNFGPIWVPVCPWVGVWKLALVAPQITLAHTKNKNQETKNVHLKGGRIFGFVLFSFFLLFFIMSLRTESNRRNRTDMTRQKMI
jgi:hypothetical protein